MAHAGRLGWGVENAAHAEALADVAGVERYDVVLGSDVAYTAGSVRRLFETVQRTLRDEGTFVLAYVSRWRAVDDAVAAAIFQYGLVVTAVNLTPLLPPGAWPERHSSLEDLQLLGLRHRFPSGAARLADVYVWLCCQHAVFEAVVQRASGSPFSRPQTAVNNRRRAFTSREHRRVGG